MNHRHTPNILFLIADDLRDDVVGESCEDLCLTPNIDSLAGAGTRFCNAFIQGGSGGAVCMPSRAMFLTGKSQFELREVGYNIPEDHVLLGECLRDGGYITHGIGKWHNAPEAFYRCFQNGGEIFFGGMEDHWNMPLSDFDPELRCDARLIKCLEPFRSNRTRSYIADHLHAGKHSTEIFADAAIDFLRSQTGEAPYFCYVAFTAPHDPRTAPKEFHAMMEGRRVILPPNFLPRHPFDFGVGSNRDEIIEPDPREAQSVVGHRRDYFAIVGHLDFHIGRILRALEESGEAENTIVVLASDHGLALGEHGLMGKQSLYEHSVRIPLILRGPGIPAGAVEDRLVFSSDVYPALCRLAGVSIPSSVTSLDLFDSSRQRQELYLSFMATVRGLRNRKFKLLEYSGPAAGRVQLFDLENDPWEIRNLAQKPEFDRILREMRRRLRDCRDDSRDVQTAHGKEFWSTLGEATENTSGMPFDIAGKPGLSQPIEPASRSPEEP